MTTMISVVGILTHEGYRDLSGMWRSDSLTNRVTIPNVRWLLCKSSGNQYYGLSVGGDVHIDMDQTPPLIFKSDFCSIFYKIKQDAFKTMEFDTLEQAITCCDLTD